MRSIRSIHDLAPEQSIDLGHACIIREREGINLDLRSKPALPSDRPPPFFLSAQAEALTVLERADKLYIKPPPFMFTCTGRGPGGSRAGRQAVH